MGWASSENGAPGLRYVSWEDEVLLVNARGSTQMGSHFGWWVNSPPIVEPILVGTGMFTGVRGFDP